MSKRILCGLLVLAAVLALGLSACQNRKKGADEVRVVLDWTPNTNHTGLYVALEKGYYAEEELKVSIMQPPEGGALLLLSAGNAEFAVDVQEGIGPAIAQDNALPVKAVAAIISHNTSGIMSLAESGIVSPKDLAGKRFASWDTPLVTAIIRSIVEADGGNYDAVRMIPNEATDAFSALQTEVDAIWIFYAWDGIAAEVKGIATNYLDFSKLNRTFDFYTPVLATNTNYAAANADQVKKFLKATSRGYTFAMEHPSEAADILLKHAPELDEALVRRSQEYLAAQYQAESPRWGEFDEARWEAFYSWMFEQGILEKDIGKAGFTNEYLP